MPISGLVGWWKLLDGSGTAALDASGYGNHGTLNGANPPFPTWLTDAPNGGGISFPGGFGFARAYVEIFRDVVLEPSAVTVCCWFKLDNPQDGGANMSFVSKTWQNNTANVYASYQLGCNYLGVDTSLFFATGSVTGGAGNPDLSVNGVLSNGVWMFAAGTYDPIAPAPQKVLYLNGVAVATATHTEELNYDTSATSNLFLGTSAFYGGGYYKGGVSDVRVYNRALSASEILSIYNGTDSPVGAAYEAGTMYAITGTMVRATNGTLTLTIDCQMNPGVATSYVAHTATPPTVTCTATVGSGLLHTTVVITPDTPVTESVQRIGHFRQLY